MNIQSTKKPPWVLLAKTADGQEVEAGRFVTDDLARQFAEDYKIPEWRIKGPRPTVPTSSEGGKELYLGTAHADDAPGGRDSSAR